MLLRRTPARVEREKEEARVDGVVTPDSLEKLVSKHSQKNEFRLRRAGVVIDRVAFPQLPWAILKDPQFLKTSNGGTLLVDGWYQYCRKPHYMADILQALCWGLICGFEVLLPYWYVCFFVPMIIHRAVRDDARCAEKYGKDWDTYIRRVPYVFVPGLV